MLLKNILQIVEKLPLKLFRAGLVALTNINTDRQKFTSKTKKNIALKLNFDAEKT